MRVFALETDLRKVEQKFLSPGEEHLITAFYHWLMFFFSIVKYAAITAILLAIAIFVEVTTAAPWQGILLVALVIWLIVVPYPLLKRYIDWRFDFLFLTTDKVIVVDQSSIFKQKVTQMNLENFASVTSETQFWNIFPLGKLHFDLKEGVGQALVLKYIPNAADVADKISDAVTAYQRHKSGHPEDRRRSFPTPPLTTSKDMAVMPS